MQHVSDISPLNIVVIVPKGQSQTSLANLISSFVLSFLLTLFFFFLCSEMGSRKGAGKSSKGSDKPNRRVGSSCLRFSPLLPRRGQALSAEMRIRSRFGPGQGHLNNLREQPEVSPQMRIPKPLLQAGSWAPPGRAPGFPTLLPSGHAVRARARPPTESEGVRRAATAFPRWPEGAAAPRPCLLPVTQPPTPPPPPIGAGPGRAFPGPAPAAEGQAKWAGRGGGPRPAVSYGVARPARGRAGGRWPPRRSLARASSRLPWGSRGRSSGGRHRLALTSSRVPSALSAFLPLTPA